MGWRLTGTIGKVEGSLEEEKFGVEAGSGGKEGAKGGDKEGLIRLVEGAAVGFEEESLQLGEGEECEVTVWRNWSSDEVSGGVVVVTYCELALKWKVDGERVSKVDWTTKWSEM